MLGGQADVGQREVGMGCVKGQNIGAYPMGAIGLAHRHGCHTPYTHFNAPTLTGRLVSSWASFRKRQSGQMLPSCVTARNEATHFNSVRPSSSPTLSTIHRSSANSSTRIVLRCSRHIARLKKRSPGQSSFATAIIIGSLALTARFLEQEARCGFIVPLVFRPTHPHPHTKDADPFYATDNCSSPLLASALSQTALMTRR